ncbi:hypothetical protein [Xanthomonas sp. MUS 060]|nr:hypothetical protein [Xanthomonas sp. MUS 060]
MNKEIFEEHLIGLDNPMGRCVDLYERYAVFVRCSVMASAASRRCR